MVLTVAHANLVIERPSFEILEVFRGWLRKYQVRPDSLKSLTILVPLPVPGSLYTF